MNYLAAAHASHNNCNLNLDKNGGLTAFFFFFLSFYFFILFFLLSFQEQQDKAIPLSVLIILWQLSTNTVKG
jgi:hypothetical protein